MEAGGAQTLSPSAAAVADAIGVRADLARLADLERTGDPQASAATALRQAVTEQVLLASFDVDEMLGRVDAEAAHAEDSRYVLVSDQERRSARLNLATFAISGALGTIGSALQLSNNLTTAGNALNVASSASALTLSAAQLKASHGGKRAFRSPYNMLAQMLGQVPNGASRYPAVVAVYLRTPTAGDGQLPDNQAPEVSLKQAWERLHRLQQPGSKDGASLASVTTDSSLGEKLSAEELADREAMLRDLHGAVALLKSELRTILLAARTPPSAAHPAQP